MNDPLSEVLALLQPRTVFSKRIGHEPRRLHFLDEFAERESRGLATALRHAHCLLNDHEPFAEQPKSRDLPGVGFQLLLDARGDFEALLEERLHDGG